LDVALTWVAAPELVLQEAVHLVVLPVRLSPSPSLSAWEVPERPRNGRNINGLSGRYWHISLRGVG